MFGKRISMAVLVLGLLPLVWRCASPREEAGGGSTPSASGAASSSEPATAPARSVVAAGTFVAGRSVLGRDIRCRVLGSGPETVLILASIHGNEGLGSILVEHLALYLLRHPEMLAGRRVLLVPEANPDGLAAGTRRNSRRVDLNRNFPAENFRSGRGGPRALSEPEAVALSRIITDYEPARVVSIHQPLAVVDYDGPGEELARVMGRLCRLPVRRLGGKPGSLGSFVGGDLGIPIVTLELPRVGGLIDQDALWRRYGPALLAALAFSPPAS